MNDVLHDDVLKDQCFLAVWDRELIGFCPDSYLVMLTHLGVQVVVSTVEDFLYVALECYTLDCLEGGVYFVNEYLLVLEEVGTGQECSFDEFKAACYMVLLPFQV